MLIASDVHAGAAPPAQERAFLSWLEHAAETASRIVLNGDLFDFWFEYASGPTRGHDVLLRALRCVVERGVPVTLLGGNHDWWGGRYLTEEIGLEFLREPVVRELAGRRTLIAHGDGLGRGDLGYKLLRPVLRSPLARWAFARLPPRLGDRLAGRVSRTQRKWGHWGPRQEARADALAEWARARLLAEPDLEMIVLGHAHRPELIEAPEGRWYVNSGDWVIHRTYVVLERGERPRLCTWGPEPS
ncbi:MAG TPA: UDP-2,3-diacylglucosamine diphosphatase [Longimicrobiales bacterium]|nr:UDP-2,3-diacylglucosamine diphosphatase [Longimicrobiales bacterium]